MDCFVVMGVTGCGNSLIGAASAALEPRELDKVGIGVDSDQPSKTVVAKLVAYSKGGQDVTVNVALRR